MELVGGEGGAVASVLLLGLLLLAAGLRGPAVVALRTLPQLPELPVTLVGEQVRF